MGGGTVTNANRHHSQWRVRPYQLITILLHRFHCFLDRLSIALFSLCEAIENPNTDAKNYRCDCTTVAFYIDSLLVNFLLWLLLTYQRTAISPPRIVGVPTSRTPPA